MKVLLFSILGLALPLHAHTFTVQAEVLPFLGQEYLFRKLEEKCDLIEGATLIPSSRHYLDVWVKHDPIRRNSGDTWILATGVCHVKHEHEEEEE